MFNPNLILIAAALGIIPNNRPSDPSETNFRHNIFVVGFAKKLTDFKNIIADIFYLVDCPPTQEVPKLFSEWSKATQVRLIYEHKGLQRKPHCPLATKESWKWHGTTGHLVRKVAYHHFVYEEQLFRQSLLPTKTYISINWSNMTHVDIVWWSRKSALFHTYLCSACGVVPFFRQNHNRGGNLSSSRYEGHQSYVIDGSWKFNLTSISTYPCFFHILWTLTAHPSYIKARFIYVKDLWWVLYVKRFCHTFNAGNVCCHFSGTCGFFSCTINIDIA